MTTAAPQRRQPVQERSRQTVARILDAADTLIDEGGVEAVTTRAVADRAGVTYPSLYRFFADRDEILDQLVTHHLAELDARAVAEERTWQITSVRDIIDRELDLHVAYFKEHPSAARLWLSGRSSPAVVTQVRQRAQVLAERLRQALVAAKFAPPDTDPRVTAGRRARGSHLGLGLPGPIRSGSHDHRTRSHRAQLLCPRRTGRVGRVNGGCRKSERSVHNNAKLNFTCHARVPVPRCPVSVAT